MNPDWSEYERLVMYRLDALDERLEKMEASQGRTHDEVIRLRVVSSMWGALGGVVSGIAAMFFHPKGNP